MEIIRLFALFIIVAFLSCQSEMEKSYGYLQLSSVDIDKELETRADVTASENIAVDILLADNIIRHADDWKELNDVLLPAETYTIKAYSADKDKDKEAQGFGAKPYYEGKSDVVIEANKAKAVTIKCKLAHAMVSISATDAFKKAFKNSNYKCYIEGNSSLSIPFVKDETRKAYVKAGQRLTLRIDFGQGKQFTNVVTDETKSAYYYNVKLDITEGNAGIDISVDQTVHQYVVTVSVPTKQESSDMVTDDIRFDVSKVWGQFAYLSGKCNLESVTEPVQFRYKEVSASEWITVSADKDGETNNYTAKVFPLNMGTDYEYYILCGDKTGETQMFSTEALQDIPNMNFNNWSVKSVGVFTKRDCWYPNTEASNSYWATGNEGVTSLKSSNSIPVDDGKGGKYAQLTTVDITMAGFAAGNIFLGEYDTDMTNPSNSVKFGRPYTGARPVKLTGIYKYAPGATMRTGGKIPADRTLTSDECEIYVMLWSGETLIAQGSFVDNKNVADFTKFECPINYIDKTKRPDKITIVASSSRYGGAFEGTAVVGQLANGSTLCVDDFELSYY